jgi:uncharacterized membrane protein YphA (DoxX/SURF4 family)
MSWAGFGYACAVALAVVLAVAAVAKVADPGSTARSFRRLGLPRAHLLARLVPAVEALTAVLLVLVPTVGGFVALTMLVFFTTFLVSRLRAGVHEPCSCFGAARSEPLSAANVVGNGFLILLAMGAVTAGAPTVPSVGDLALLALAAAVEVVVHRAVRARVAAPRPTAPADPVAGEPPGDWRSIPSRGE